MDAAGNPDIQDESVTWDGTSRTDDALLPVSFAQERAWLRGQMHPDSPGYLVLGRWRLTGRLDTAALERAFRNVVQRHTVLRARMRETSSGLATVIHPAGSVPFEYRDLSSEASPDEAATTAAEIARGLPVAADADPLTRVLLLRLAPDDHVLQILAHEAVFDHDSGPLLAAELSAAYAGCLGGYQPLLAELPVQYSDYAAWQRKACSGEHGTRLAEHWRAVLAEAPQVLELPTDHARPPVLSGRGRTVPFTVPVELAIALRELARIHESTMYEITLAAYQLLLSRYGGTPDVVVGIPTDPRQQVELQRLIGPLAGDLPVRTRIDDEAGIGRLLEQVRWNTRDASAHQNYPVSLLAADLAVDHDLSRHPIFQAWFHLVRRDTADRRPALPGIRVTDLPAPRPTGVIYDLALYLVEEGETVSGTLTGPADLFEQSSLRRFARNYLSALTVITSKPTVPLRDLEVVAPEERDRVLHHWNDAGSSPAPGRTVVEQFETHARNTPHAPALTCGDITLSYRELDSRARQVALGLGARGVGPGSLVGVCLVRELDLPVALLGVAKAGAGYVGLDPADPQDRLATVLRRSGADIVIGTEPATATSWPVPAVTVDGLAHVGSALADAQLPAVTPSDVVYVLYTSGSTGQPKGVVMSHGPTARLMHWAERRYRPRPVALAYFPATSDVFSYELWSTWWTGGRVVLAAEADRFDPASLAKLIASHQVTTVLLPGAVLDALAAAHPEQLRSVTEAITTGDRLLVTEPIRRLAGLGIRLDNQWGSTEVNVVTAGRLDPAARHWPTTPGIGSPVAGGRIYVLDEHLRPVPIGVPGGLYVGGTQPGYGYLGQPDLTAAAFLPDPYHAVPGTRMYSMGDLGRWLEDGTLEFLGRADQQAKVHGYRVDPGEIEAVITEHPGVARAAVVVVRDTGTGTRLAAYLQAAQDAGPDTPALRDWIRRKLPGYMMPSALSWLDVLPQTATGKVDRQALPAPDFAAAERTPPRDSTERAAMRIWQDILGRPDIGITDNFFDLGGYSMLIPQVVYWLNQEFGVDLPLQVVFRAQTIRELADEINSRVRAQGKVVGDASTAR